MGLDGSQASPDPSASGFAGGVFDGRYVYLAPNNDGSPFGLAVRYDTQQPFASATAWQTFDFTKLDAGAKGYRGAAFDGKYVYFVPSNNGTAQGIIVRFDPAQAFGATNSWTTFNLGTDTTRRGFIGAIFDGRYLNLLPSNNGSPGRRARAARHDDGVRRIGFRRRTWAPRTCGR